jgi:ATP-binding cassette subfamily B protein
VKNLQDWEITAGQTLAHGDHAGVGTLELSDGQRRLASWRYTLGYNPDALRLADQFDTRRDALATGRAQPADTEICPTCKAPLPPGEEQCPQCSRELETPPSTWALLRLWRFARPYRWELLGGFVLLLLGTAATLVPPYLTMPLMDKVLIPYQNGVPIDIGLVKLYLAGLLGAALVAWVLGWARTCWPGVGAHQRRPAHHHLRTFAQAVARVFRRQADRRPDGAHRLGERPH